jgi:hypothetical protein
MSRLVAVCKGAVARVLETAPEARIRMRESNRSFGIVVSQAFSPYLHAGESTYNDPFDKGCKVKEQITWLIKKGDLLLSSEEKRGQIEFYRRFGPQDPKVFINRFVSSISDNPPLSLAKLPTGEHSKSLPYPRNEIDFPLILDQRSITLVQYDLGSISDMFKRDDTGEYLIARLTAGISLGQTSQWYISFNGTPLVTQPLDSIARSDRTL